MTRVAIALTFAAAMLGATGAEAQWFNYPTSGLPRTTDGKPDLKAASRDWQMACQASRVRGA